MKTGLGVQLRPVKILAPRSYVRAGKRINFSYGGTGKTYVDGTDEIFITHEHIGHAKAKDDGADPSANEAFYGLLGRQLYELRAAKGNSTNVCKYVVDNDQCCREKQPDHAFEDAVHDEMRLDNDEI